MKIYQVGGCVRDELMGLEPKDIDYVVVGSTPEEMLSIEIPGKDQSGKIKIFHYEQVGKDFPVFLHPLTQDEYALARTERKTGVGYNGFDVETSNVTLEEDLFRRDLTINAMAKSEDGTLIDPYGGAEDLKKGILRHVSPHFKEDPVRILRIARFSARYNFDIAQDTLDMMTEMVNQGEFDHLTGERVWKEFEKVLSEQHLHRFFQALESIGALQKIKGFTSLQEYDFFNYVSQQNQLDRFTLNLLHVFSSMSKADLKTWKMPTDLAQKITQFSLWKNKENFYQSLSIEDKISFIQQNKALHDTKESIELLSAINLYQSWKFNLPLTLENHLSSFEQDVEKLKSIDYKNIVDNAIANKEKPNLAVKDAQINVLSTVKKGYKP